ncbi:cytochrome P450 [Streptomyces sp. NPDC059894]|uniref:cytochrome P450 n=1 Tax=unclassified Streptomyces TaxID=2593676 RepID=UPI003646703D
MDLSHPLFTLDPFAADARAEAQRLLEAGPVVPVDVVGVPVWAVTRHAVAQQIVEDPSFSMNSGNRGALQRGEVPAGRPLMEIITTALFDTTEQPTQVTATEEALHSFMAEPAASKAADPGDDLTSIPVEHHTSGSITHDELVDTLMLMLTAGHQTTTNFFTDSLLALMTHPEQLGRVRAGEVSWQSLTESVPAWDSPVDQGAFRYPAQDIEIGGVLIRAGEPVMTSYVSLGHDPAQHGPLAASFGVTRDTRHLSFGHGPHLCVGAPLARLEAHIALPAFFDRFDAELAVPRDEVEPVHSLALNGVRAVPAIIRPRQEAVAGG